MNRSKAHATAFNVDYFILNLCKDLIMQKNGSIWRQTEYIIAMMNQLLHFNNNIELSTYYVKISGQDGRHNRVHLDAHDVQQLIYTIWKCIVITQNDLIIL